MSTVTETTYGTAVTTSKFFEYHPGESINADKPRFESVGFKAGTRVQRSDRFVILDNGAKGSLAIDVLTKGFGFWLVHMLGTVGSSTGSDSMFTHSGSIGSLQGHSFTLQINRPTVGGAANQAFTYKGCKLTGWDLGCAADNILTFNGTIDAQTEDTTIGLAAANYPTGAHLFSFANGSISVGTASYDVKSFKVAFNNNLLVTRKYVRNSLLKKEPLENNLRDCTVTLVGDFDDMTQYSRFVSATISGAVAQVTATFMGPVIEAGSTIFPQLTVSLPNVRFDGDTPNVTSPGPVELQLNGKALDANACTITYTTSDSTP